jgi:hypothetical protein
MSDGSKDVVLLEDTDVVSEDEDGEKQVDMAALSKSGNAEAEDSQNK